MNVTERMTDSLNALVFKGRQISVHTKGGQIGSITGTCVFKGEITVQLNNDGQRVFHGRDVADLDTPFCE